MKKAKFKKLSVSAMTMVTALSMLPAIPAYARNLEWENVDGKEYWYENDVKMGVYGAAGNVWYDGTERGKEIYDPGSDAWYWLDACYDGAKAVGKEVFMPYIYGNEKEMTADARKTLAYESNTCEENYEQARLGFQIWQAMATGSGKWVRYDENGRMLKGWVTIEGPLAEIYTTQVGNVYYYDRRTGIMAKGVVEIDGKHFEFDRVTGALIGETDKPTDEEAYFAMIQSNSGKTLLQITSETVYETPRDGDRNRKTVYHYDNPDRPTMETSYETFGFIEGEYRKTNETIYELYSVSNYSGTRTASSKTWSWDSESQQMYLYSTTAYVYGDDSRPYSNTGYEYTYYDNDGSVRSVSRYSYVYNENGRTVKRIYEYVGYSNGQPSSSSKEETAYTYNDQGQTLEEVTTHIGTTEGDSDYVSSKYVYTYDENGNRVKQEYYSNTTTYVNGTSTRTLQLSNVTGYVYTNINGSWHTTQSITYAVENGVLTDKISSKYVYTYDEDGNQILSENYTLRNGELTLYSRSEYKHDDRGYTVSSRGYYSDAVWQDGTYVSGEMYPNYGYDYEYKDIFDSRYTQDARHAQTKYVYYVNQDKDGTMEVSYYVLYDADVNTSYADGLEVGETKVKVDRAYNADDTLYYTTTSTYEVRSNTVTNNY